VGAHPYGKKPMGFYEKKTMGNLEVLPI